MPGTRHRWVALEPGTEVDVTVEPALRFEHVLEEAFALVGAADVHLRPVRPMRPGRYDLVVTATDRAGRTTTVRRSVALRPPPRARPPARS